MLCPTCGNFRSLSASKIRACQGVEGKRVRYHTSKRSIFRYIERFGSSIYRNFRYGLQPYSCVSPQVVQVIPMTCRSCGANHVENQGSCEANRVENQGSMPYFTTQHHNAQIHKNTQNHTHNKNMEHRKPIVSQTFAAQAYFPTPHPLKMADRLHCLNSTLRCLPLLLLQQLNTSNRSRSIHGTHTTLRFTARCLSCPTLLQNASSGRPQVAARGNHISIVLQQYLYAFDSSNIPTASLKMTLAVCDSSARHPPS